MLALSDKVNIKKQSKSAQGASKFASDVKKLWFLYLTAWMRHYGQHGGSVIYKDSVELGLSGLLRLFSRPSVAILEGDPVDYTLDWQALERIPCPLVNIANVSKPRSD
jgi:hypothetical protein